MSWLRKSAGWRGDPQRPEIGTSLMRAGASSALLKQAAAPEELAHLAAFTQELSGGRWIGAPM